ncbi:serine protease [Loktanella sp. R86503]|uniref:S1 family peptidase n=1 Tax=Loktanella sp. R86503 TaxID=3093847 RepID=UPI0036D807F0
MFARQICAFAFILAFPTAALADFVKPGDCAIIVASRQSVPEALNYIRDNAINADTIFASRNGWYAISVGTIPNAGSSDFVASLAARATIPPDSYCSTGEAYVSVAWSRPVSSAIPSTSGTNTSLDAPFDARPLTTQEKRYLQAGLTLQGTYSGLTDGEWGRGSQTAYEAFLTEEGWMDTNRSAAILAILTADVIEEDRWTNLYMPAINASLYYPAATMSALDNTETRTTEIDSYDGSIATRFYVGNQTDVVDFHLNIRRNSDNWGPLYESQSDGLIVTGTKSGSFYAYARSLRDPADGLWSTVYIVNQLEDKSNRPALMASGFQIGRAPSLDVSNSGYLMKLVEAAVSEYEAGRSADVAATTNPPPVAPPPPAAAPSPTERFSATGSGFYINADAAIMTNAHVIKDCDTLTVEGEALRVIAASDTFDLALLAPVVPHQTEHFLSFAAKPARLNSDITIAGFPLQGILNGLNITRGSVSSMEGLEDATRMQISAPVQPGNSGGPIVDRYGRVVGIVVARLNYEYTKERSGAEPQNINFGIRGAMGAMFAGLNDVVIRTTELSEEITPEDLADQLRDATVLIQCEGSN